MAAEQSSPVFLLTFANEQPQSAYYLRNLAQELSRLRATLEQEHTPYQLVFYPNMTVAELLRGLRTYRHRIALLHYGGHSDSYSLFLQAADGQPAIAHSGGLAKLLAHQPGLHLIFLNGCANAAQAQALLDAGIAVVVATSTLIDDQVAMHFADHFYAALAADATIADAFDQAAAAVELQHGANTRNLYYIGDDEAAPSTAPWQLYKRDEAALTWRLSDLSNDPCWGLPPLPRLELPAQPFRYLAWFRAAHAEIFFGRGQEIRTLYEHITDPDSAPILLLYGQSGVGKSSLLEAGLLPRLAAATMPYYVRRDRTVGLTQSLAAALCARTSNRTVAATWRDHERIEQKPLVVVLDQVEELFTRPQPVAADSNSNGPTAPGELADFLCTLGQLFKEHTPRPQGKLILGFRKEYLAEIEKRLSDSELPYRKFFLEPLNQRGLLEAITGVARTARLHNHYGLTVEDGLPELMAEHLRQDTDAPLAPTLQILLAKLWAGAVAENQSAPRFDQRQYRMLQQKGILLSDFFEQSLQALATVDADAVTTGLLLDLLAYHTTPWGTAEQHQRAEIAQRYPLVTAARLAQLLQKCQDHYLLADPAGDQAQPLGVPAASRLAHDALAPLVREHFARSEAPGQRARRLLESCVSEWRHDPQTTRLDDNELALVEQHQANMRVWTADEAALVQASCAARTARQQQATRQRIAQRRQRQLRQLLITLIGVALLVIGVQSLRGQKLLDDKLRQESIQWSEQAEQQLTEDPVASLTLARRALPSVTQLRPYVPQAEFTLLHALNSSLERVVYQPVHQAPLSAQQVALSRDWIAVGGPGLRLLPFNLSPSITVTIASSDAITPTIKAVAWNSAQDTLLSQEAQILRLWQGSRQRATAAFTEPIACAAWQPNTENIVVCAGQEIALWQTQEQQPRTLFRFTERVVTASWSPDGRWLVAWDAPRRAAQQLLLWDSQTAPAAVEAVAPLPAPIYTAAWAPDSQHLVTSSSDGRLHIRQMGRTEVVTMTNEHPIDQIEFVDQTTFLTWGIEDVVRLWSIDGTLLQTFGNADEHLQGFRVNPARPAVLVLQNDGTARQYQLTGGAPISYVGHNRVISAVAWRDQGNYLATGAIDGTARVWDGTTGKLLLTLHGHTGTTVAGRADVLGVAWQPDGRLLTYGEDGSFRLWAIFDQQGLPLCEGEERNGQPRCHATAQSYTQAAPLLSAHWLDQETVITVDEDRIVQRLTRTTGDVQTICDGADEYTAMAPVTTPAQRLLFFFTEAGSGQICDLTNGRLTTTLAPPISTAQWIGERLLLSRPVGALQVVDAASGAVVAMLEGLSTTVAAAVNPAGQLATATVDGVIDLWTLPSGVHERTLGADLAAGQRGDLTKLTWSADGKQLLAIGSAVRVWDVTHGKRTEWAPNQSLAAYDAQMSVDQQWLTVSTGQTIYTRRATGRPEEWQRRHDDTILGMSWFTGVRWPHEERYHPLIARLVHWLNGEPWTRPATRQLLLTWSGDGTAQIWDAATATPIMRLADSGRITLAAISPDGAHLVTVNEPISSGEGSTVLRIWPLWQQAPETLLAAAQQQVTRPVATAPATAFSPPAP